MPTRLVLGVGISTAFVILYGMGTDAAALAFGYTRSLSSPFVFISFGSAIVSLTLIAYLSNRQFSLALPALRLTTNEKALLIVPALLPGLSILGTHILNLTGNNVLVFGLFLLIASYVGLIIMRRGVVPERLYPPLIVLICVSLLMVPAIRSNHLFGSDTHEEFRLFLNTLASGHWTVSGAALDSALSVSILPSVYQLFLKANPEYLFKVLYSLLFVASPVVVYITAKKYLGPFYAFLASFLFMSQVGFMATPGNARTNVAILFFALGIMVLFHDRLKRDWRRSPLFLIFSISVVASHYSSTYIFFFMLLFTWVLSSLPIYFKRFITDPLGTSEDATRAVSKPSIEVDEGYPRNITAESVAIVLVLLYFWYGQVTTTVFNSGVGLLYQAANFQHAFLLENKGGTVTGAIGIAMVTIPQRIRLVLSWITVVFMVFGIFITLVKRSTMMAPGKPEHAKEGFLGSRIDLEFLPFALACGIVMVAAFLLPFLSRAYDLERTSFLTFPVMVLFFSIGAIVLARWVRVNPGLIIGLVVIPFFLSTTGVTYQLFGDHVSINLNSEGREYNIWYVHDEDQYGAKWLEDFAKGGSLVFTGAWPAERVLMSQTRLPRDQIQVQYSEAKAAGKEPDAFVYLRYADTRVTNLLARYPTIASVRSLVYDNGGAQVYR